MSDPRPCLAVLTPWYPTADAPYAGAFVRASVLSLRSSHQVTVVHLENVAAEDTRGASRSRADDVDIIWIPVPVSASATRPDMARLQRDALRRSDPPEIRAAEVVHVHVGMPTGWAVTQVIPPGVRLVVTEHSSTLGRIFRLPEGREMYREVVARAAVVLPVSEHLARSVRAVYPEYASKVQSMPNAVDLDRIPFAVRSVPRLSRWLYVGNLIEAKGVLRVVRAFACWRERDSDAVLTLVGAGYLREQLERLAEELGVREHVVFVGPVSPDEVAGVFAEHDLLVHLSAYETFGLTVLEAIAAGLPVVATRSGGPDETLAEAVVVDRARLVAVSDDVDDVIAAVEELESVLPDSQPLTARLVLERRYGRARVADRLRHVLDTGEPDRAIDEASQRSLAVSLHSSAQAKVLSMARGVAESGGAMVVVTNQPKPFRALGPAVTVVDVSRYERRFLPYVLERAVVSRVPGLVLSVSGRAVAAASRRVRGRAGEVLYELALDLDRARRRYARFASRRRPRAYARVYEQIAPWWLARKASRGVLQDIDLRSIDVLITPDWRATPFAWRLLKRNPDLSARRPMSRHQVAREYATRTVELSQSAGTPR